eukprot:1522294-Rhodomonas_salina.2
MPSRKKKRDSEDESEINLEDDSQAEDEYDSNDDSPGSLVDFVCDDHESESAESDEVIATKPPENHDTS